MERILKLVMMEEGKMLSNENGWQSRMEANVQKKKKTWEEEKNRNKRRREWDISWVNENTKMVRKTDVDFGEKKWWCKGIEMVLPHLIKEDSIMQPNFKVLCTHLLPLFRKFSESTFYSLIWIPYLLMPIPIRQCLS